MPGAAFKAVGRLQRQRFDSAFPAAAATRAARGVPAEDGDVVGLVTVLHPLLPLFLDPRVVKVFFETGAVLQALAPAGLHPVNVFSVAAALEEAAGGAAAAGARGRRLPADEAGLAAALGEERAPEAGCAAAARAAEFLLRAADAASDVLCGATAGAPTLARAVAILAGCADAALPPNALERAVLRSQTSALARPPHAGAGVVAGVKRPRAQEALPPECVPPWFLICKSCGAAAGHYVYDCSYNTLFHV